MVRSWLTRTFSTYRVRVTDVMVMVVQLGTAVVVIVVVPRAQFEDVRQGGEEEEQHLQHELLCGAVTDEERQQPQDLNFDQLDHDDHRQESQQ